jgi:hypothetical protein
VSKPMVGRSSVRCGSTEGWSSAVFRTAVAKRRSR